MRTHELVRRLAALEGFARPSAELEQVETPPEAAVRLLTLAAASGDLEGRRVVDLGCGTGRLAIGAALLGALEVVGVESDATAIEVARRNAERAGVALELVHEDVARYDGLAETVVMNPPFGAQRAHADRPFLETALRLRPRRLYAFALAASRSFIARWAVLAPARVERTEPVRWDLPRTFPHHRRNAVELSVDLWVLEPARDTNDDRSAHGRPSAPRGPPRDRRRVRPRPRDV